jgi:hypothetical protein
MTAPGWYPDPGGQGQRYYDGTAWTEQRAAVYASAPPARKGTHPVVWVLLGLVLVPVLFFGGCAALVAIGMSNKDSGSSSRSSSATESVSVGQHVSDGKFDFVVDKVETAKWVGQPGPRGIYIIAHMTVTNTGAEPQSFFAQNQKLIDTAGREYAADGMAAMSMNRDSMVIDMNPGFSITVKVPFDVPPGTVPDKIEVHDSAFSGGATVDV